MPLLNAKKFFVGGSQFHRPTITFAERFHSTLNCTRLSAPKIIGVQEEVASLEHEAKTKGTNVVYQMKQIYW